MDGNDALDLGRRFVDALTSQEAGALREAGGERLPVVAGQSVDEPSSQVECVVSVHRATFGLGVSLAVDALGARMPAARGPGEAITPEVVRQSALSRTLSPTPSCRRVGGPPCAEC